MQTKPAKTKSAKAKSSKRKSRKADAPDMPFDLMGLLFFAYREFVKDADSLLEAQGLGRAHHRVLYFVCRHPGMKVSELLDILDITKQSLARVLRQLIDLKYIVQKLSTSDKRQRLLHATAKGERFFATLSQSQADRIDAALASMPMKSRDIVYRFLMGMVSEDDKPHVIKFLEGAPD